MKKLLPLIILGAIAGYLWHQNKTALESGHPEQSLLQKAINMIPSQTLREKIPGSADARAVEEATQIRYRFTQTWQGLTAELLKPMAKNNKPMWAKNMANSITGMNTKLAGLSSASKAEQRLGYLGQKFNTSLMYVNTTRQNLQNELRSALENKTKTFNKSRVSPEERALLYLQSVDKRWKDFLIANEAKLKSQLQTLKEAEGAANAAAQPSQP